MEYIRDTNSKRLLDRLTTVDLPTFHQRAIGFDRIFDEFARTLDGAAKNANYPPYNVVKYDDTHYGIELAVAGFSQEELDVVVKENTLTVRGTPAKEEGSEWPVYIHRGIAHRSFERVFTLAENMEVEGATVENGVMIVSLVHRVPEEKMPKRIAITFKGQ
jgi:molecular chaperone IbpA